MYEPVSEARGRSLSGVRRRAQLPALVAAVALFVIAGWMIRSKLAVNQAPSRTNPEKATTSFDFSELQIPHDEIRRGGPPKDGIPALTSPNFLEAGEADYLAPEDRVIGISTGGVAKAYPLKVMDFHEIVNDTIVENHIAVTYCPLCDSSVAFDANLDGKRRSFGVSGLLYQSNVLMYDRAEEGADSATEGLWTQMGSVSVSGAGSKRSLNRLPLEVTSWKAWQERYPDSLVLSNLTGHARSYEKRGYGSYFSSDRLMFPVSSTDDRLPKKTPVLGVVVNQTARAYLIPSSGDPTSLKQKIEDKGFTIVTDPANASIRVENADEGIEWCYSFWFAWHAFNEETELYEWEALTE